MSGRETVRDYAGMIVGHLDHESNGDITVRNYAGQILGRYYARDNLTKDFYGKNLYRGNMAPAYQYCSNSFV